MALFTKQVKRDFLETCAGIRQGSLRLITPEGEIHDFGAGEPRAEMTLHDWSVVTATMARGDIGLGETYVAGLWDSPSIEDLTVVALRNFDQLSNYVFAGFWAGLKFRLINRVLRANSRSGSARNIRAHYDVGNEFYQLWLDPGLVYWMVLLRQVSGVILGEKSPLSTSHITICNCGLSVVCCELWGWAFRPVTRNL